MLNYIHADLHRILRRVPRIVILLLVIVIANIATINTVTSGQENSIGFMSHIPSLISVTGAFFGVVEIMSVFADDFRAKTMQVAIGLGISRRHVVLAKAIEYAVLILLDTAVLGVTVIADSAVAGIGLNGDDIYQIVIRVFLAVINALIPALFTMIPIFYLQGTGLAAILFLVFYIDPLAQIFSFFLSTNEFVIRMRLGEIVYSSLINAVNTSLTLHTHFPLVQLLGLAVYVVAGYLLTVLAFNKRELEF
ncbi:hypothetical protein [Gemmiger sp.]